MAVRVRMEIPFHGEPGHGFHMHKHCEIAVATKVYTQGFTGIWICRFMGSSDLCNSLHKDFYIITNDSNLLFILGDVCTRYMFQWIFIERAPWFSLPLDDSSCLCASECSFEENSISV